MSDLDFYIDTVCEDISGFDSGYANFNEYLRQQDDTAVIHYMIEAETEKLVAYFSLLSSALLFGEMNNLNSVPAIELKMFAVDKQYQKTGVTPILLNAILRTISHYAKEYVGANIVLLYSVPVDAVVGLYERCGFQRSEGLFATYTSTFNAGCVPMFKGI